MGPLPTVSCSEACVSRQCGVFAIRMSAEGTQLRTMVWAAGTVGTPLPLQTTSDCQTKSQAGSGSSPSRWAEGDGRWHHL